MEPAIESSTRKGKRKLTRWHSNPQQVELKECLCVSGGWLKKPLHVDTVDVQGVRMTAVQATTPWLPQLLQGFCRAESLGAILKKVSADLQDCVLIDQSGADKDQACRAAAGREDLFSDGEDSDGAGAAASGGPEKPSPMKRKALREPHCVSHRGHELRVAWRRKVFYVEASSSSVASLFAIVQSYKKNEVPQLSPAKKNAENNEDDCKEVKWLFGAKAWCVHYVDEEGKPRTRTKGLVVPHTGFDGRVLDSEEYSRVREEVRKKATDMWNELDRSNRPRLS